MTMKSKKIHLPCWNRHLHGNELPQQRKKKNLSRHPLYSLFLSSKHDMVLCLQQPMDDARFFVENKVSWNKIKKYSVFEHLCLNFFGESGNINAKLGQAQANPLMHSNPKCSNESLDLKSRVYTSIHWDILNGFGGGVILLFFLFFRPKWSSSIRKCAYQVRTQLRQPF